uniref:Uncharacterized protein n=1 Tax=Aegilops tauschii TaxID=37682 RepID=M8CBG7_AEGTA
MAGESLAENTKRKGALAGGTSSTSSPRKIKIKCKPNQAPELLRGYFEASGNVLDAAIRGFKDYLASGSALTNADAASSGVASDVLEMNARTNSIDWAELIVREMSAASDLIDAKSRAFRILELFDKSAAGCNTPDEKQKMREEHKILKQMLGGLLHQNGVLKRAFLIQHNRLKDYQDMVRERSQFKEIVDKYQQQIKALEDRNYVLSLHLAQSDHRSGISGHRNPDVF